MSPFGSKVREEDFIKSQKNRVIRFDFQRRFCISSLRYRERTRKRERRRSPLVDGGDGGEAITSSRAFFFSKGGKKRA